MAEIIIKKYFWQIVTKTVCASEYKLNSIAFPSVSTGIYGYPIELASRIALVEISNYLKNNHEIEQMKIICFGKEDYETYQKVYQGLVN